MTISGIVTDPIFHNPLPSRTFSVRKRKKTRALNADLKAALVREEILLHNHSALVNRHALQAREFDHRLFNGLQMIAWLLSSQSRNATPEVAAQLGTAASRVIAFGRVHRQLHLLDNQENVEIKQHLRMLCEDLAGLLFEHSGYAVSVEGIELKLPSTIAIRLGYIVNELITNAAKYAASDISVRIDVDSPGEYSLSVSDRGPGLPEEFDMMNSKGLGMTIITSLAKQIGAKLIVGVGEKNCGTKFLIRFRSLLIAPLQFANNCSGVSNYRAFSRLRRHAVENDGGPLLENF